MFIRIKTTPNSPRRSVQVVDSVRKGDKVSQRIVRYVGVAHDDAAEQQLRRMGQEFIDSQAALALTADALFATTVDEVGALRAHDMSDAAVDASRADVPANKRQRGRPPRQSLLSVLPIESVLLDDVREVSRRIEGPHEVFGALFDQLHFDQALGGSSASFDVQIDVDVDVDAELGACINNTNASTNASTVTTSPPKRHNPNARERAVRMLRDLVIARVMTPASKRDSARALDADYGKQYSTDSLYRLMDRVHQRLDDLKRVVFDATRSLCGGRVDMMLFDVTTLYFESVEADELRAFGYSKDQKYHCTQVVLALATNEQGLPIGYELFPGNTAEVRTLISCMSAWQKSLSIEKVSFVADRALCSRANLSLLEAGGWSYVVAMPLQRSLKEAQAAQILNTQIATAQHIGDELAWVREFEWEGRRLIVSYSAKRAHKDHADRQAIIDKLQLKLAKVTKVTKEEKGADKNKIKDNKIKDNKIEDKTDKKGNARKLISNSGYLKYIEQADSGGVFVIDTDKIADTARWDGLHAIVTNDREHSAAELLARYRTLWVIEDSFRLIKHNLAVRPIYHFKRERIEAHIGLCYLAFALLRHARTRIKVTQGEMSIEHIKNTLKSVQASILEHKRTKDKYRLPSAMSHDANKIYRAFGLKRSADACVLLE